jgi:hypothetical protein
MAELEAFCDRLNEIQLSGGKLSRVQIYTVARPPAEATVTPLTDAEVDAIAQMVRDRAGITTNAYYGSVAPAS